MNGGYDDGYAQCGCFWGIKPGALVRMFLTQHPSLLGACVLDLGCGEGKNAYALAEAGADVIAVDCSAAALANGKEKLAHSRITWVQSTAHEFLQDPHEFDVVVMYGLLHCLASAVEIRSVVQTSLEQTRRGGHHIVVTFNDGPHDLTAHPGFKPTLLPHESFVRLYDGQEVVLESKDRIEEVHPHNNIPHSHSLTRLIARRLT
jgi:tellurite methyltransferase